MWQGLKFSLRLSVHETMKYATFRYDTVEVENSLKNLCEQTY